MASLHVKKGDRVKVITGKDKGVIAEVIAVDPASERVTVQGVNLVKKHRRESQTAAGRKVEGGIITVEAPIHVSNVQLVVKVDGKEVQTITMEKTLPMILQWDESFDIGSDTLTGVNDADYKPPFTLTAKLNKLTIKVDRPELSPEDIKELEDAMKGAADAK